MKREYRISNKEYRRTKEKQKHRTTPERSAVGLRKKRGNKTDIFVLSDVIARHFLPAGLLKKSSPLRSPQ
jgi:hypothetical protein